jgi:hypothetical protein
MTFGEDWRSAFPGVNAATHFRARASEYIERLPAEADGVAADVADQGWAPDFDLEGVPQPALDEVRSLFERAGQAAAEGDPEAARKLLQDVIAFCTP